MKPFSLTPAQITAMIDEINEHITAVTSATVWEVTATVFDSIAEGAFWADSEKQIAHGDVTAIVEKWISDSAGAPIILDSSIAAAVSSMMNSVEQCNEPDAARRTADVVSTKIIASGGRVWINPMHYDVDQISATTPGARYGNKHGLEYIKWPNSQVRDIVEIDGKPFRVVANYVSPGKRDEWQVRFSFFAVMPV